MNSNWFRHDNDAHSDERCAALIARTGYEGYGMLWHLLERMHRSTDGRINLSLLDGIAWDMKVDVAKLKQVLSTATEVGLFTEADGFCYSERMQRELEWRAGLIEKRSKAGRKGGLAKAKSRRQASDKQKPGTSQANAKHPTQPDHTQPIEVAPPPPAPTPVQLAEAFFTDNTERDRMIQLFVDQGLNELLVRSEVAKFVSYWTEPNRTGKQVRWQAEKHFDVKRRLLTWFSRVGDGRAPNRTLLNANV